MPVQRVNNNDKTSFSALYKIQTNSISKKVEDLIIKRKYISIPSSNCNPQYYYVLTPNNKKSEKTFEDMVMETGGKFWKSLPIKNVLNKDIAGKIFDITRLIEKKENWLEKNIAKDAEIMF